KQKLKFFTEERAKDAIKKVSSFNRKQHGSILSNYWGVIARK
ncbi:unnamed protein product, partial [marine sediment metagenome]